MRYRIRECFTYNGETKNLDTRYVIEERSSWISVWSSDIKVPTHDNGDMGIPDTFSKSEYAEEWLERIIRWRDQKVIREVRAE